MYRLTRKGREKVSTYIRELQAKRKEILDAGKDTADETQIPSEEDILSDIELTGTEKDECGVSYYANSWGVTDNYNSDMPISLELGIDFVDIEYDEVIAEWVRDAVRKYRPIDFDPETDAEEIAHLYKGMCVYGLNYGEALDWAYLNTLFGYDIDAERAKAIGDHLRGYGWNVSEIGPYNKAILIDTANELGFHLHFEKWPEKTPERLEFVVPNHYKPDVPMYLKRGKNLVMGDTTYNSVKNTGRFRVKTPKGYLMVEAKGVEEEYPGVFISFSEDGKTYDVSNMIACVEYLTGDDEISTETYVKDMEEPNHMIVWEDGRDRLC